MTKASKWLKGLYTFGVVIFLLGFLDPLEGSILILIGSALIAITSHLKGDRHRRLFLLAFLMIILGVVFLFYLSSLGGFGGESDLSWWWALLILPYPLGWLLNVIILIMRWRSNVKSRALES